MLIYLQKQIERSSTTLKKEPLFSYNPESGEASCLIEDKDGNIIYGIAKCHPDDMDMANEKTGCNFAYKRAYIKVLQAYKKELKIQLGALNQLYYSMNRSKYFNPKSYENKMLQRQIRQRQEDISYVNDSIKNAKDELNYIIKEKDKFYQGIRKHRNEAKN